MKTSLFTLLFLLITTITMAQNDISCEFGHLWQEYKFKEYKDAITQGTKVSYDGTPYLECKTNSCTLILNNHKKIDSLTIRYNIYQDQMEIERKGTYYVIPRQKEFAAFLLEEQLFRYLTFKDDGKLQTGNLEVLVEGKCSLYRRYCISLKEAQAPKPYQDPKPASFKNTSPEFFLNFGIDHAVKVTSTKEFISALPTQKDEVSLYIKKNKLKLRKQEDLEKVVEFYNSL